MSTMGKMVAFLRLLWVALLLIQSALSIDDMKIRMTKLRTGANVPPSPSHLQTLDGTEVPLWVDDKPTVVCFLRHLA